jgi:metal-responsive CopG/Arc/MetJ family transcriptional regulator
MAHIGVSVSDDTKAEWEEYIEESDMGSMSELVRSAVRKEIRHEEGGDSDGGIPREMEEELTRVAQTQETLEEQMESLLDGFEDVEEATTSKEYPEEVKALAHQIANEEIEEMPRDVFQSELRGSVRDDYWDIARRHQENPNLEQVFEAFEYLEENISYIKSLRKTPDDFYRVRAKQPSR